jgi:Novel toxin 17/Pretoxin HINT domain
LSGRRLAKHIPIEEQQSARRGRWIDAGDLVVGDVLLLRSGEHQAVLSLRNERRSVEVFNLNVETLQSYGVSSLGVLVHNRPAVKQWSIRERLRNAGPGTEIGLPGGNAHSGPFRFRPPENYNPQNQLPTGPNGGYLDRFGNEWVKGPYHGDPSLGFHFEWDIRLTPEGARHWNKFDNAMRRTDDGGLYLNVRPDGVLSH